MRQVINGKRGKTLSYVYLLMFEEQKLKKKKLKYKNLISIEDSFQAAPRVEVEMERKYVNNLLNPPLAVWHGPLSFSERLTPFVQTFVW